MIQFLFLFQTLVTVPPLPAPRSFNISKSSFLTVSSPPSFRLEPLFSFVVVVFLGRLLEDDESDWVKLIGVVGVEDIGLAEKDDPEDNWSLLISSLRSSASEV